MQADQYIGKTREGTSQGDISVAGRLEDAYLLFEGDYLVRA